MVRNSAVNCSKSSRLSCRVTLEHNLSSYTAMNQSSTEYQTLYDERTSSLRFYVIVAITSIVLSLIRLFAFFAFARLASISMHKAMVRNVLNSTMRFFDSHLIGNILTRFSKDFVTVDETIPFVMIDCLLVRVQEKNFKKINSTVADDLHRFWWRHFANHSRPRVLLRTVSGLRTRQRVQTFFPTSRTKS
jgi:ABC-type multidrug transport system fused ATPase/permease subunit